jgi:hypothetical protein
MKVYISVLVACDDGKSMGMREWDCPIPPVPMMTLAGLERFNSEDSPPRFVSAVEIDIDTHEITLTTEIDDRRGMGGERGPALALVKSLFGPEWAWDDSYPVEDLLLTSEQEIDY